MEIPKGAGGLKQKCLNLMIKIAPVEPQYRNNLKTFLSWALYVANYLIILYIISNKTFNKIQSSNVIIIAINITRAGLNLLYIFSKQKLFFVLQKLCILLHCILTCNEYSQFFKPLLLLDLLSGLVWSLSLQQKSIHFDSRLFIRSSFVKQVMTTCFYFVWISVRFGKGFQQLFYISFGLFLLMIDSKTNYYSKKFKNFMLGLDLCCLISSILPILSFLAQEFIKYHQIIVGINIICVVAAVKLSTPKFKVLYELDPWLNKVQSQQILDYVIALQQLTKCEQNEEVLKYIVHHIRICQVPGCFLKYHEKDNHHSQMKPQQVLKIFGSQQLAILSKRYAILQEYVIFNSSVQSKQIRNSSNKQSFFHMRENQRFLDSIQSQSKMKATNQGKTTTKVPIQFDLVPQIKYFTELGLQFWSQLLQYKINSARLLQIGAKQAQIMKKIQKVYGDNVSLDLKSEEMVHYYFMYLLGNTGAASLERNRALQIQDNLSGLAQAPPTLLVSAEKQNFLRITNANLAAVKATGFTKQQMTSITVDVLWDKQIREDHIVLAERRARYSTASEGELIRSYAFLKNKFGYIVITDAVVYYFDDLTGKKWCVVCYPFLQNQAIFVTNSRRQLVGISDTCVSYGLRTNLQGQKLKESLFLNCVKTGKPIDLSFGTNIFQSSNFRLVERQRGDSYLKYETKIDFLGKPCYYVFSLGTKKAKIGLRDSVSQLDFKILASKRSISGKNNSSQTEFPLFQFNYNFAKNLFEKRKEENAMILFESNQVDEINQQSESWQPKQINPDIIEMRLWKNKIDFLENLSSPVSSFGSLPAFLKENQILQEDKVKNEWKIRSDQAPAQIKWLRSLFIIFLVLSSVLVSFINVVSIKNKSIKSEQLTSHQTLMLQHGQLITLSSILLQSFYSPNSDLKQKLSRTTGKIDETYKKIESMDTINNYLISYNSERSLFKADDIYRLLIKNYLEEAGQLDDVIFQLINFISQGWQKITLFDFSMVETQNNQVLRNYLIFTIVASLFLIANFVIYLQFRRRVQKRTIQMCLIFLSIDHRAISSQVTKFKSFKQYIDLDRNLIKEESIGDMTPQDSYENMYPKRTGNPENFTLQSVALAIGLVVMGLYFGLVTRQQYNVQSALYDHYRYLHSSNLVVLQSRKLWITLHLQQMHEDLLEQIKLKILDFKRDFQFMNNQQLDNSYFSQGYQQFWQDLSYRNVGLYLPQGCRLQVQPLVKNGQKQLIYSTIRMLNKCINKFSTLSQYKSSSEAMKLFKINKFYLGLINQVTSSKIKQEFDRLLEYSKNHQASSIVIYIIALILITLWFVLLSRKIKEISSVEELLYTLPFKQIEANHKYIQYLNKVRINQR